MAMKSKLKIILLFEGTKNDPKKNPSAISRLGAALVNDPSADQVVLPISGSGTHGCCMLRFLCASIGLDSLWIVFRQIRRLRNKLQNEKRHCDLYVFGFSRGAYQARLFVNLICLFRFKVQIRYLGLIDTVRAGLPVKIGKLYDVPRSVERCRHVVAIHEYRVKFSPKLINVRHVHPNVEERYFLGCHSDVGWAYNGSRYEHISVFGLKWKCCRVSINRARTKLLGKIALSWLIDPVVNELMFLESKEFNNVIAYERSIQTLRDYIDLAALCAFLVHNPIREISNLWGVLPPRLRRMPLYAEHSRSWLHYSASAVRDLYLMPWMLDGFYHAAFIAETIVLKCCLLDIKGLNVGLYRNIRGLLWRQWWLAMNELIYRGYIVNGLGV